MKRIEKRGLNLKFYWLMPGGYLPPKKLKRENGFAVLEFLFKIESSASELI